MVSDPLTPAPPKPFNRVAFIHVALAIAVFAVYGRSISSKYEFVNFDDQDYVTSNKNVQAGLTADSLSWSLTAHHAFNWHPLTWISLQIDQEIWQVLKGFSDETFANSARVFRFTNILLHTANTLILFWLLRRMTGAMWCSAMVAALFGLHPTHVESVAWISERKDVLSTLFWLLTIAAYQWYAVRPSVRRYLLVAAAFVLGLTAKPMLVTLPAVLLLLDYWPLRRWPHDDKAPTQYQQTSIRRLLLEKAPLFALVALSIMLTLRAQSNVVKQVDQFSLLVRVENAFASYVQYIVMSIWPSGLAVFYPHRGAEISTMQVATAALALISVSALVLWLARQRKYLLVGWLWYLGTLVPVIGLVQVGTQAYADRYTYVPTIGLYVAAVWGIVDLTAHWQKRAIPLAAAAGVILVAIAFMTYRQVGYWRDSESLWRRAVAVTHRNAIAHGSLGIALAQKKQWPEAYDAFRESLLINAKSPPTHIYMAVVLENLNRPDDAAQHYEIAIGLSDRFPNAHTGVGKIRARQGRFAEAERHFCRALQIKPDELPAMRGLADVYQRQQRFAEALEQLDFLIVHDPNNADAHNARGHALERLRRLREASESFEKAVHLESAFVPYRWDLAYVLHTSGNVEGAETQFREMFKLDPNWPQVAFWEAWMRACHPKAGERNGEEALRYAKIACQGTNYRTPQCLDALAASYAELGRFDEAIDWTKKALALFEREARPDDVAAVVARLKSYEKREPARGLQPYPSWGQPPQR